MGSHNCSSLMSFEKLRVFSRAIKNLTKIASAHLCPPLNLLHRWYFRFPKEWQFDYK